MACSRMRSCASTPASPQGDRVGIHYDAMLAKIIVAGASREAALAQLAQALRGCRIEGVTTNLAALLALARDAEVRAGRIFTRLIDERGAAAAAAGGRPRAACGAARSALTALRRPARNARSRLGTAADAWALTAAGATLIRLQPAGLAAHVVRARARRAGLAGRDRRCGRRSRPTSRSPSAALRRLRRARASAVRPCSGRRRSSPSASRSGSMPSGTASSA